MCLLSCCCVSSCHFCFNSVLYSHIYTAYMVFNSVCCHFLSMDMQVRLNVDSTSHFTTCRSWCQNMCWSQNSVFSSSLISVWSVGFPGQRNTRLHPEGVWHLLESKYWFDTLMCFIFPSTFCVLLWTPRASALCCMCGAYSVQKPLQVLHFMVDGHESLHV